MGVNFITNNLFKATRYTNEAPNYHYEGIITLWRGGGVEKGGSERDGWVWMASEVILCHGIWSRLLPKLDSGDYAADASSIHRNNTILLFRNTHFKDFLISHGIGMSNFPPF